MADEDPEKRFHSIMDKLFKSQPPSSSSGLQLSRGIKRANPESALALVEPKTTTLTRRRGDGNDDSAVCRPWDRGDLMRRLSTFKSMSWFAKPKVVSAVNCARRGWINVDMDIIACETCGARLLFSTPSSWTQQQVEKAALVFSLKLDNGHKLLCPWIDNACEERLAEFPPISPPVLVDKFQQRSSALLRLFSLPVISSSAIEYMKSPQLEEFLMQSPVVEYGRTFQTESLGSELEMNSVDNYYKALKLISLCGWELRSLPYLVDCNDKKQTVKDGVILSVSDCVTVGNNSIISVHHTASNETMETNEESGAPGVSQADPNSVVLDCRLCGASVGLWTFSTVSRPVELFRLVGYAEASGKINSGEDTGSDRRTGSVPSASNGSLSSFEQPSNLNMTIAGGPPPTKQDFKATISLPVVGQSLRARFSLDSKFKDWKYYNAGKSKYSGNKNTNLSLEEKKNAGSNASSQFYEPAALGLLESKTGDQGQCNIERNDQPGIQDSAIECPAPNVAGIAQTLDQSGNLFEHAKTVERIDSAQGVFDSSQVSVSSVGDQDTDISDANGRNSDNDASMMLASYLSRIPETEISGKDVSLNIYSKEDGTSSDIQNRSVEKEQLTEGIKDTTPVRGEIAADGTGAALRQQSLDNAMEFDPIRQHRHFCPWIVTSSSGAPGWEQTLSALLRLKEHSHSPSIKSHASSTSLIKVDDPITSVRMLFKSPSTKKMKPTC
ncbi:hypothetical protein K2173_004031 [Erythroxylum novogranatense]|uniref:C3HC-type domain-containing protein n=1 Tax=Erythroxylum novogranatense TaxID=1862640 RepID=A0AAV8SJJ5_9ROSI|nr:hypothetical protein K2173_004031 [Erythroxylum novogranatense]